MSRFRPLALALAIIFGLTANQVFARGGGHGGGGHHGGGHHGGAHHSGHHASHHHSGHHSSHHHHAHYGHHNRPFSHGWYGHHGGAWGGWGWGGWGGAWAPAAFGTAATWLGLSAAEGVAGGYEPIDTVYTSDSGDDENVEDVADTTNDTAEEAADNEAEPQEFAPAAQAAEQAGTLAKAGVTDPPKTAELLPLGVYSLAPQGHHEATAMLQLSVAKDGVLRGSYFDVLSNKAEPIQGAVDKKTQRVAWSVGKGSKVLFETSLANLTQEKAPLTVHYENGQSRPWTIARYKDEEGQEKKENVTEPGEKVQETTGERTAN